MEKHLHGFLRLNGDSELCLTDEMLAVQIANELGCSFEHCEKEEIENVSFRFYASDVKLSLEEVSEKYLLNLMGMLTIDTDWYGYSEYTIEGYTVSEFKLGGHDLDGILRNYVGKYVHILIDRIKK